MFCFNLCVFVFFFFFFSSRRRHTRSYGDWSSDVCSSDLAITVFRFVDARGDEGDKGDPLRVGGVYGGYGNRISKVKIGRASVGKECRCRGAQDHEKKKKNMV